VGRPVLATAAFVLQAAEKLDSSRRYTQMDTDNPFYFNLRVSAFLCG
jgi:hypothetical protein